MKKIVKAIDTISDICALLVCIAIVASLILTVAEILARSLFNSTTYIANEYTGYCMALISFLGFGYGLKRNSHIRLNMLDRLFHGRKWMYLYYCVLDLIGLAVALYMAYHLTVQWLDVFRLQTRSIQVSATLIAIPLAVLPLGSYILGLQFLCEICRNILLFKGRDDIHVEEAKEFI